MEYICAPMEGVTDSLWRRLQREHFAPADRYYAPFISPTQNHLFSARDKREILPENNAGINLVPQLLGHNAEDMLWALGGLQAMGYREVNINLGCPSGTVVSKKKGSGLLAEHDMLEALLDTVFEKTPVAISVKTRIGLLSPEEFPAILDLYNRYPIALLTVHPRVQKQLYRGIPAYSAWEYALRNAKIPLCYNGNLFDRTAAGAFTERCPAAGTLMFGRGAAANPKLFGELRGEAPLQKAELLEFHAHIYAEVSQRLHGERAILLHMKELWAYMGCCFEAAKQPLKKIFKAQNLTDYDTAVSNLFARCALRDSAGYVKEE